MTKKSLKVVKEPAAPKRMVDEKAEACYNCKYYLKAFQKLEDGREVELRQGVCRRFPPQLIPLPPSPEVKLGDYQSGFPTVSAAAFCGEFKR